MDLPLSYVENGTDFIARADHYGPYISLYALPLAAFSTSALATPQADFLAFKPWAQASADSATGFSGECYMVALGLFEGMMQAEGIAVPVGAIMSDWPGASITQLVPPSVLTACNSSAHASEQPLSATFPGPIPGPGPASSQWNTMVAPLTVGPLAVNNFVYHQGEADVHGSYDPAHTNNLTSERVYSWYSCRLRALMADFVTRLGGLEDTAWFGISQLNPYAGDCSGNGGCSHLAALRSAQFDVAVSTPRASCGVIPDLGDPWAPAGSVHSRRKLALAQRLVAGALALRYNASAPFYGPRYSAAVDVSTPSALSARVSFSPASLDGGLQLVYGVNGTSWCPVGASPTAPTLDECGWYSLKGSLSGWQNATLSIDAGGSTATLSAARSQGAGDAVVATAAYWSAYPVATLFSRDHALPAVPWNQTLLK